MPLTQFLKIPVVSKLILERYPFPSPIMESTGILCPPKTTECGVAGTAVDYVFRAILEKKFSRVAQIKRRMWIAEELVGRSEARERRQRLPYLDEARKVFHTFLEDGKITYAFIRGMCLLARLDTVYRSNNAAPFVPYVNDALIEDVAEVTRHFDVDIFARGTCYELNPIFDFASRLVGGADADLIINYGTQEVLLVDFKTTKENKFTREHWLQLVGYSILRSMLENVPPITHVGIYFSRHRQLKVIPLSVGGEAGYMNFLDQFSSYAATYRKNPDRGFEEEKPQSPQKPAKKAPRKNSAPRKKAASTSKKKRAALG